MYSTFKQKSRVSSALKSVTVAVPTLTDWHDSAGTFENVTVPAGGGPLMVGEEQLAAGLPSIEGLSWDLESNKDCINVGFKWSQGCPPDACDGFYQLCRESDSFKLTIKVGENNQLGFDR
jgi:hypothetical protein